MIGTRVGGLSYWPPGALLLFPPPTPGLSLSPRPTPDPPPSQDAVVGRLSDAKAEVRTIACATLAGMIKGMGDAETAELRAAALANARLRLQQTGGAAAASRGVKRGGGGGGGGTTVAAPAQPADAAEALLQKHAAVLVGGWVGGPRGGVGV